MCFVVRKVIVIVIALAVRKVILLIIVISLLMRKVILIVIVIEKK